ncbi:hypothetical protein KPL74_18490 [Bacillus sp. NP157]|nr:hypothetical protein KPL74_18490 [Bacillus sp. NP157]
MRYRNLLPLMAMLVAGVVHDASADDVPIRSPGLAGVTLAGANRIMRHVVSEGHSKGEAFEQVPNNARERDFYVFEVFRTNAKNGESDVSAFMAISKRSGRIVVTAGEWCYPYPEYDDDKAATPIKPTPGADLPAACEDPTLGK